MISDGPHKTPEMSMAHGSHTKAYSLPYFATFRLHHPFESTSMPTLLKGSHYIPPPQIETGYYSTSLHNHLLYTDIISTYSSVDKATEFVAGYISIVVSTGKSFEDNPLIGQLVFSKKYFGF